MVPFVQQIFLLTPISLLVHIPKMEMKLTKHQISMMALLITSTLELALVGRTTLLYQTFLLFSTHFQPFNLTHKQKRMYYFGALHFVYQLYKLHMIYQSNLQNNYYMYCLSQNHVSHTSVPFHLS